MKKFLKTLTASCLVATAIVASAAAASYNNCADALNSMGLFKGTNVGYDLDRAPTRAEAGTMLVRLLGKEEEAKKLSYTAPFTDVANWQKPYVQYLYDNGLTTGVTATKFDPESKCSAKMYAAFSLRALGYTEKAGDYTYAKAVEKAYEVGLADYANCNETNFLRDNVVAMSYTALNCSPKGEDSTTLLDQLVKEGAVSADMAKKTDELFAAYDEYSAVKQKFAEQTKVAMNADIDAKVSLNGQNMMTLSMPLNIKTDMNLSNLNKSKMEMTGTMKLNIDPSLTGGEQSAMNSQIAYYYTDGMYYMNLDGEKIKMPLSFDEALQGVVSYDTTATAEPVCLFTSITKSGSTITAKYSSDGMTGMIDSIMGNVGLEGMSFSMKKFETTETIKNNAYSGMTADIQVEMKESSVGTMNMDMGMKMTIVGTGDSVKVSLPSDLASYQSIDF